MTRLLIGVGLALAALAEPRVGAAQTADLVLRPAEGLRPLAVAVRGELWRRAGLRAELGEAPPPGLEEAVPSGHVALTERDGALFLGVGAAGGATHVAAIEIAVDARPETARTVALAIESLLDESFEPPLAARPARSAQTIFVEYEHERPPRESALPTVYLRVLLGWSPTREQLLIGPGAGFGLCVGLHCVVLEAELPLLADERPQSDGALLRYRALTATVRGQARVMLGARVTGALGLGLLTRIGIASLAAERQSISAFGVRSSVELAWRVAGPFEVVVEGGVDAMVGPMSSVTGPRDVVLEDRWTPWAVLSARLRPPSPQERGR
ncbi:MAG: hypothetical protein KF901_00215 [Myxococcales bacterium]|nr:hypothetical protein [Myxococcales bacterium]